jgi:hypothetical protein
MKINKKIEIKICDFCEKESMHIYKCSICGKDICLECAKCSSNFWFEYKPLFKNETSDIREQYMEGLRICPECYKNRLKYVKELEKIWLDFYDEYEEVSNKIIKNTILKEKEIIKKWKNNRKLKKR